MKNKNTKSTLTLGALSLASLMLFACNLTHKAEHAANKVTNEVAKVTKTCEGYKTENQADGENEVKRTGIDYKFNLYWSGIESKMSVREDNLLNDNYVLAFDPLAVQVLGENNAEVEKISCKDNKDNAGKCITRLEKVLSMIKEARESYTAQGANVSEGKDFTFKCAGSFAEKRIAELKQIQ